MTSVTYCPKCNAKWDSPDSQCRNCFYDISSDSNAAQDVVHTQAQTQVSGDSFSQTDDFDDDAAIADLGDFEEPTAPTPTPERPTASGKKEATKASEPVSSEGGVVAYRPRHRPPMAVLKIYDDDGRGSEEVRLRKDETTIGRADCDIVIPHEKLMSGRHAMISRRYVENDFAWYLTDLESRNGVFLKIQSGKIRHEARLLIGAYRYQFVIAPQDIATSAPVADAPMQTMEWGRVDPNEKETVGASLIRISPTGEDETYEFPSTDVVIGANAGVGNISIKDDDMLNQQHVRIYRDERKRWNIESLNSTNGVWLAIDEIKIDSDGKFQLGEQRFGIRFF
ncbi:MAG: FHA domain-containing protein [bacterium]|nr:FHA domain-containing protein [bacterium]